MIASLELKLTEIFGSPYSLDQLCMQSAIRMKTELITCWKSILGEAVLQEFNGLMGYCYHLELYLSQKTALDITSSLDELHVLYPLRSTATIKLTDPKEPSPYNLAPKRARYFYLPTRHYTLHLPAGRTQLFGFFFRAKLFRNNSERPFRFLHQLIQAKREGATTSLASVDFRVGPRTEQYIRQLMENARMGDFDSEDFVHRQFMNLIKISRTKVYDEYERTSDPEELIKRFRQRMAEQIRDSSQPIILKDIAAQLRCTVDYLSKLHLKYHKSRLSTYRDELLLKKIKALLLQSWTLLEISEQCGFQGSSEMGRFFKRKTGITPNEHRKTLQ